MQQPIRLTRRQLAERLGLKPNTLAQWAMQGRGPKYISHGARVVYDLEEVERWEREHTHRSTASIADTTRHQLAAQASVAARAARRTETQPA